MKIFSALLLLFISSALMFQDETREIWDTGFLQKRPAAPAGKREHTQPRPTVVYKPEQGETKESASVSEAAIGLTIWRLRPLTAKDTPDARILVQDTTGPSSTEMIPERIDLSKPLHAGDRIRISIEVPRRGYLYVIDREQYRDGSLGDPVLVFPTLNINHGNNQVEPGQLVEIPPQNATVRALRLERDGERHIGEDLMLMVTPNPLKEIVLAEGEQNLSPVQVNQWDRAWRSNSLQLGLVTSQHDTWTLAEKKAGGSETGYLLTQSDPMPATIVGISPHDEKAFVVHVALNIQ